MIMVFNLIFGLLVRRNLIFCKMNPQISESWSETWNARSILIFYLCSVWKRCRSFKPFGNWGWDFFIFVGLTNKAAIDEERHSDSLRPKKFRVEKSAGKVLTSVYWNYQKIIMIDFLDSYYSTLLTTHKFWKKNVESVLFSQENAPTQNICCMLILIYIFIYYFYFLRTNLNDPWWKKNTKLNKLWICYKYT